LKRYYEVEYMASLLSTEMKTQDNVVRYIQSCRERDIQILSPDVNRSDRDFSVVPVENASKHKYGILFGMGGIKGVGDSAIEAICEARTKHGGYFGSIYGFCEQVDLRKVNKKVMEALVKSGAMDQFKQHRSRLFEAIPRALETGQRMQKDLASGQTNLFGAFAATINTNKNSHSTIDETYPDIEEWPEKLKLRNEKDALGFYISGHPLGRYNKDLARLTTHTTANLTDAAKGNRRFNEVHIAGVVSSLRERPLKNGKGRMAFLALEDLHGTCEVIVFSRVFNEVEHIIKADEPICVRGVPTVEGDDESLVKIRAQEIELLSDIRAKKSAKLKIKMSTEDADAKKLRQIREALAQHPGSMPVTLHLIRPNVSETLIKLPNHLAIQPHDELLQRIETIVGSAGVKLD